MADELLALTFIQPWGTAVLQLGKDVENRPWAPWPRVIGKRITVHAGAKVDKRDAWGLLPQLGELDLATVPRSALLGTVRLIGFFDVRNGQQRHGFTHDEQVLDALGSKWRAMDAKFWWVFDEPLVLPEPIPCPGSLSLWRVPAEHVPALRALEAGHA